MIFVSKKIIISFIISLFFLFFLPLGLSTYALSLLIQILIFSIFAMSFDLIMGYLGECSFGPVAFWGMGAYILGIIHYKGLTDNFWMILGVVILAGLLGSLIIGLLVIRTTGVYFVFINLAIAQLLYSASYKLRALTGGEDGITGISRPWNLEGISFYYFILLFFITCFLLIRWIVNS